MHLCRVGSGDVLVYTITYRISTFSGLISTTRSRRVDYALLLPRPVQLGEDLLLLFPLPLSFHGVSIRTYIHTTSLRLWHYRLPTAPGCALAPRLPGKSCSAPPPDHVTLSPILGGMHIWVVFLFLFLFLSLLVGRDILTGQRWWMGEGVRSSRQGDKRRDGMRGEEGEKVDRAKLYWS